MDIILGSRSENVVKNSQKEDYERNNVKGIFSTANLGID